MSRHQRLRKRPMVFTTNKPMHDWGRVLHDPDLAAAILDRVLERAGGSPSRAVRSHQALEPRPRHPSGWSRCQSFRKTGARKSGTHTAILGPTGTPRVIGVVRDIKCEGLDSPAGSAIYLPWAQRPLGSGYLIVRTGGDSMRLAPVIRRAARELDPTVPMPELQSLEDAIAQSIANRRVRALPAIGFGALALAVALVGVLATFMTLVAERKRDLAIRSALGASPGRLAWAIVGHGVALAAVGLIIGLGVGSAAARALSPLLYRVSPFDLTTFVGTALLIGSGAVLTTYFAALRVRSVDPLAVLRSE